MSRIPPSGSLSLQQIRNSLGPLNGSISLISYTKGHTQTPFQYTTLSGFGGSIPRAGSRGYVLNRFSDTTIFEYYTTGFEYQNETSYSLLTGLPTNEMYGGAGVYTSTRGYVAGYNNVANIGSIQYASETGSLLSASLAVQRSEVAGYMSTTKGYFAGGVAGVNTSAEIDGLDFASETAINPSAALSSVKNNGFGLVGQSKGYFAGGEYFPPKSGATLYSSIEGLVYNTETNSTIGATLAVARSRGASISNTVKGYAAGGRSSSAVLSEIDGLVFASEAAFNPSAALSEPVVLCSGLDSGQSNGYSLGGTQQGTAVKSSLVNRLSYSTDTVTNLGRRLDSAITGGASVSNRTSVPNPTVSVADFRGFTPLTGYVVGGSEFSNEVCGLVFGSETSTTPSATVYARTYAAGASGKNKGYVAGGRIGAFTRTNYIESFDFSTETASAAQVVLTTAREQLASVSNFYLAYFAGGNGSTVDGLYLTNETYFNPNASLSRAGSVGITGPDRGYFVAGGLSSIDYVNLYFNTFFTLSESLPVALGGSPGRFTDRNLRGFVVGGFSGNYTTAAYSITYNSNTVAQESVALSLARGGITGVNSHSRGYAVGGQTATAKSNEIDGIQFSTTTAINPSASLSGTARSNAAGFQSGFI